MEETPNDKKRKRKDEAENSSRRPASSSSWVVSSFPTPASKSRQPKSPVVPIQWGQPTGKVKTPWPIDPKQTTPMKPLHIHSLAQRPPRVFNPPTIQPSPSLFRLNIPPTLGSASKPLGKGGSFKEPHTPRKPPQLDGTPLRPPSFVLPPKFSTPNFKDDSDASTPPNARLNRTPLTTRLAFTTTSRIKQEDEKSSADRVLSRPLVLDAQFKIPSMSSTSSSPGEERLKRASSFDMELLRGMDLSPDKPSGSKGKSRFVKNGLAERASMLISRAQNDLSLWSHDIARSIQPTPSKPFSTSKIASHAPRVSNTPDMRLVISDILVDYRLRGTILDELESIGIKTSAARAGAPYALAKCKVTRVYDDGNITSRKGKEKEQQTDTSNNLNDDDEVLVLFSFSTTAMTSTAAAARISSVVGFDQGKEVMVWRPWIEVDLSSHEIFHSRKMVLSPVEEATGYEEGLLTSFKEVDGVTMFNAEPLPAWEKPPDDTEIESAGREKGKRTFLCSRFVIIRQ